MEHAKGRLEVAKQQSEHFESPCRLETLLRKLVRIVAYVSLLQVPFDSISGFIIILFQIE